MYLSVNVHCHATADLKDRNGIVLPQLMVGKECQAHTLMGEFDDQFFDALAAAGYQYNETTQKWVFGSVKPATK
ncbi:MAG: hypothetical protein IT289_04345 [Oligoflexia bacterium]|nr:hypothetical protein [Oligoflexia bacterium]